MKKITIRQLQGEEFLDVLFNFQMYAFRASPSFMEAVDCELAIQGLMALVLGTHDP
jgi:hypothetical protein